MCMYMCVPICLYVHHMHTGACRVQKRPLDTLKLVQKQVVVNCCVNDENQIQVI